MTQNYALISPDITLQEMVNQGILGVGRRAFLVQDSNQIIGVLAAPQLKKVAIEKWPETTAAQAMAPLNQIHLVQSQSDLWESINEMEQEGVSQLPVLDDSQVQGVLSREGVISFMKKLQAAH
jgi:predicted transcriptional regulator